MMVVLHSQGKVKHYVFVSSAGAYKANSVEPIHMEGDERKASAGHVKVKIEARISTCAVHVHQPDTLGCMVNLPFSIEL